MGEYIINIYIIDIVQRKVGSTKGVIRSRKPIKDRQYNGQKKKKQKDKQRFTKLYIEN